MGENPEIASAMVDDFKDPEPVHLVVCVDREIAETDGFTKGGADTFGEHGLSNQRREDFPHGFRRRGVKIRKEVGTDINAQLDGTLKIHTENILKVDIANKIFDAFRAFGLDAKDTARE